jgi:hypothetical protein
MFATIIRIILGPVLDFLSSRDDARIAAMNDSERRAHDDRQNARNTAREVRLATAGHWEQRVITAAIVLPFVVHLWLVGIDTMWPQPWNVEKWPAPFDEHGHAILLSYFGVIGLTGSARAVAGAIAMRGKGR